jgi:hypothetical protein
LAHVQYRFMKLTRAAALAFLAAFSTLFAQVAVHRIVSAKMLNNYAFFVLSLTMLGFAASGTWLALRGQERSDSRGDRLSFGAALFGLGLVVATTIFYVAPSVEDWNASSRLELALGFLSCIPFALLYAAAFAGSGLILGILLSAPDLDARRVYFVDLVGSAAGAFAVIPAVSLLGAERAAMVAGLLLLAGVAGLAPPSTRATRLLCGLCAIALLVGIVAPEAVFRLRYPRESPLGRTQVGDPRYVLEHVTWDPIARIEVSRTAAPDPDGSRWPALFGPDREMLSRFRLLITQNNNAYTYAPNWDGEPATLRGLQQTIYAAAYEASGKSRPRVLAIGVGGGMDVLTALSYEASSITGVEVNGATLEILRRTYEDHFRPWVGDPRVTLVHDDGRHHLASRPERYDVLQLSGVDSVSGTPGAAHVFSENYLYTAEALDLYLSRLDEDGVLAIMRPEYVPPRDMLRLLLTVVEALERAGRARPADHVIVVVAKNGELVSVLVKLRPFSMTETRRAGLWATRNPYLTLAAAPGFEPAKPNLYHSFLSLAGPRERASALARYPYDVMPVTDDRPFFFRTTYWSHLWPGRGPDPGPPTLEIGLLSLLLVCGAASFAFVLLPLRALRRRGSYSEAWRPGIYFTCIGLGYMGVEMAFIQKFGLLLGHPNYALSVVLASLLFATGVGALLSQAIVRGLGGRVRYVGYALAGVLLAELLLAFPHLHGWIVLPMAVRTLIVTALVAPVGLLLGVYFPTGLERLKQTAPAFVPWAWGLNGMASVVAPVLSVGVSVTFGVAFLVLSSIPIYLLAGLAALDGAAAP